MSFKFHFDLRQERLLVICKKAGLAGLRRAAFQARRAARRAVKRSPVYAPAGSPPHTRRGQLKKSILYAVDNQQAIAVVGPAAHLISDIASYHEHGGWQVKRRRRRLYKIGDVGPLDFRQSKPVFGPLKTAAQVKRARLLDRRIWPDGSLIKKVKYPQRPLMGPTLVKLAPQLPQYWENALRKS